MAWTNDKNILLRDLLNERIGVENSVTQSASWELTRSWIQILNAYVTNAQKQLVLNDLIDDKVAYLNRRITFQSSVPINTTTERDTLLTNKE